MSFLIDFVDLFMVNLFMKWVFLLFAIVFGGVGFGIFFGLVLPDYRDIDIAKTGTLVLAEATGAGSNLIVNDVSYYHIFYKYQDKSGKWIEGKTNPAYTHTQVRQILDGDRIVEIRVKGGRAVAADFKGTPGTGFLWIFVIAFGGVGLGMGVAFVLAMMVSVRATRIRLRGIEGEGYYINSWSNLTVNGTPMYKLEFGFKTAAGEEYVQRTPSKYQRWQVMALENMGQFKIKYLGKRAIVYDRIKYDSINDSNVIENTSNNTKQPLPQPSYQEQLQPSKRCEWCGAIKKSRKCDFCGN